MSCVFFVHANGSDPPALCKDLPNSAQSRFCAGHQQTTRAHRFRYKYFTRVGMDLLQDSECNTIERRKVCYGLLRKALEARMDFTHKFVHPEARDSSHRAFDLSLAIAMQQVEAKLRDLFEDQRAQIEAAATEKMISVSSAPDTHDEDDEKGDSEGGASAESKRKKRKRQRHKANKQFHAFLDTCIHENAVATQEIMFGIVTQYEALFQHVLAWLRVRLPAQYDTHLVVHDLSVWMKKIISRNESAGYALSPEQRSWMLEIQASAEQSESDIRRGRASIKENTEQMRQIMDKANIGHLADELIQSYHHRSQLSDNELMQIVEERNSRTQGSPYRSMDPSDMRVLVKYACSVPDDARHDVMQSCLQLLQLSTVHKFLAEACAAFALISAVPKNKRAAAPSVMWVISSMEIAEEATFLVSMLGLPDVSAPGRSWKATVMKAQAFSHLSQMHDLLNSLVGKIESSHAQPERCLFGLSESLLHALWMRAI
jgi:hypothetical protein